MTSRDARAPTSAVERTVQALAIAGVRSRRGGKPAGPRGCVLLLVCPDGATRDRAAVALGKTHDRAIFRVDLSRLVSKYIDETEKNLERVFARAEGKQWVLFFDEADALFGKRTDVRDANDRFANQVMDYLLQRIEALEAIVVLASNLRPKDDGTYARIDLIAECG